MSRLVLATRAVLAAVITLTVLLGVPTALIVAVGWPLPASWPDPDTLTRLTQTGVSDVVVANTLAVIVWCCWAQLAVALIVETVAAVRRHAARPLPLLPGLQPLAARLVAAILLLSVVTQPRPATASALEPNLAVATTQAAIELDEPAQTPAVEPARHPTVRTTEITTGPRDSWWQLAEHHLGDGLRWREIRTLNLDRRVATDTIVTAEIDQLDAGWQLLVPTTGDSPPATTAITHVSHPTGNGEAPDKPDGPADTHEGWWEVRPGEHFWSIATQVLTDAWERTPTDAEVTSYWQELVEENRDRLDPPHDPDLIHPGQRFRLPLPPAEPAAPAGDTVGEQPEPEGEPEPELPRSERPETSGSTGAASVTPDGPSQHPSGDARDSATTPLEDPSTRPAPPDEPTADRDVDQSTARSGSGPPGGGWQGTLDPPAEGSSAQPRDATMSATAGDSAGGRLLPGLAAAALAAAGILALWRRRQRAALQQRPTGMRLPTPAPEATAEVARLEAAAADQRTLHDLGAMLTTIPEPAQPALVTSTDQGEITLLFADTDQLEEPPAPWRLHHDGADGPVGWRARLGTTGPERSFGLPLLVTLGTTGSATVLGNLAALPVMHVTGPPDQVRRVLRNVSLELSTSRTAGPLEVAVAGDDALATVEQLRHVDDLTGELDAALAERDHGVLRADRTPRLLVCHQAATAPTLPDDGIDGLVGLIAARDSFAADAAHGGWRLNVDEDGTGRLHLPDGGQVELTLAAIDPEVIDTELVRLDEPGVPFDDGPDPPVPSDGEPDTVVPSDGDSDVGRGGVADAVAVLLTHPAGQGDGQKPSPAVSDPVAPAFCEVRLLGPVEVTRDGEPLTSLTPLTQQLLLYLVTHRDGVTSERLDDVIWAGQAAPPRSQRLRAALTKLRDALGDGPDGQPLLPRRQTATSLIRLSEHVGSDLDRAFAHLARARDLDDDLAAGKTIAALSLVRGEPFEGLPLAWATEITQRAISQLQDAAVTVAAILRQAQDHDDAERLIHQALRLCDPCEALYLEWAKLEADRGRGENIRAIWQRLRDRYGDDADETAGWTASPTLRTAEAFEALLTRND